MLMKTGHQQDVESPTEQCWHLRRKGARLQTGGNAVGLYRNRVWRIRRQSRKVIDPGKGARLVLRRTICGEQTVWPDAAYGTQRDRRNCSAVKEPLKRRGMRRLKSA